MTIFKGDAKKGSRKRGSLVTPLINYINSLFIKSDEGHRRGSWNWFITYSYLVFMLVLPISSLLSTAGGALFSNFWQIATDPIAVSTYVITLSTASLAALFNGVFGFILAW